MMKKLIFCLLALVGTGALSGCQQDEVANEVIENKGVTIRASLPGDDARSRVILGETSGEETQVYWEEDDVITLKIDENTSYTFEISDFEPNQTTAKFTCTDEGLPKTLEAGTYTFTYGNELETEQAGTKEDLSEYHRMTAEYIATEATAWENVNLTFNTQVAIVEISLPDDVTASKVSLYNAANGAKIATTPNEATIGEKVYFAVAPGTYEGLVVAETANANEAYRTLLPARALESGNLYRIADLTTAASSSLGTVRYVSVGDTYVFWGSGSLGTTSLGSSVTRAIILEGVESIGNNAFYTYSALTSVIIPKGVTSIGESAFETCSALTSVIIPEGVTSIGKSAFQGCSALTSVTIPTSVTSIGESAFDTCSALTSVTIPEGVTSIGRYTFQGCAFTSVTIPEDVKSIGQSAFANCDKLTSVTIPASVTSIGLSAFANCDKLTSVIIPESVTNIGNYAFQNCLKLESVTCKATIPPTLGSNAFNNNQLGRIIYVPSESVDTYKAATQWSTYASDIQAIQ